MAILPTNTNTTVTPFIPHTGTPLTQQGEPAPIELLSKSQVLEETPVALEITEIVLAILSRCDLQTLGRLARVNRFLNACVQTHDEQLDLHHLCPNLRILNAKAQGITVNDEPRVSKLWTWKNYRELEPQVENREGLTLLTMPQGRTLNQLIAIAAQAGINATPDWDRIVEEYGNVPVEQTYVILITNNVFQESRYRYYAQQQEFVARRRCAMPTVQEYVALCVFTNKVFQKCLYRQDPWTFGRTSTQIDDDPLIVGGSAPGHLFVDEGRFSGEHLGAGGQRRFGHGALEHWDTAIDFFGSRKVRGVKRPRE